MTRPDSDAPQFVSLDEAAAMTTGTRVTFIPGIPAMYSEALKNICHVKGVPLIRALHPLMGVDEETGEDGLLWNMRILNDSPLARKYGYSEEASADAPAKVAEVIRLIDRRLEAQARRGSPYLVGDAITAIDVYRATLSMTVAPAPPEIMPITKQNRRMLEFCAKNGEIPEISDTLSERIRAHQRSILTTWCETPAVLGGDPI
jgi:hypothetical protein